MIPAAAEAERPPGAGLVAWVLGACAAMWFAPRPPPPPPVTAAEQAAWARSAEQAVARAAAWQARFGDRTIPWDEATGHLAIVVDDVGRDLHLLDALLDLRERLTFSVLPGAPYAAGAQLRLLADDRRLREVWLHLPMEPERAELMGEGSEAAETFLLRDDDDAALAAKVRAALARVPAAVGVNNHMGSALSADPRAMAAVMGVLCPRGYAFLDSRTTAASVAARAARRAGCPVAERTVFLDADPAEPAIAAALERAVERAEQAPTVAIVHPSPEAVRVLRTRLPGLAARGVGVYPLTELLTHLPPHPAPLGRAPVGVGRRGPEGAQGRAGAPTGAPGRAP